MSDYYRGTGRRVRCPWHNQRLYDTLGEGEDSYLAECRAEGCEERVFTIGIKGKKEFIVFIEDDKEGMVFHYGKWERDEPRSLPSHSMPYLSESKQESKNE